MIEEWKIDIFDLSPPGANEDFTVRQDGVIHKTNRWGYNNDVTLCGARLPSPELMDVEGFPDDLCQWCFFDCECRHCWELAKP